MAPDLASPSGGIKVIYNFVAHLCALGYDARVWHGTPGFAYANWASDAPVDTGTELDFGPGDVLVIPETGGGKWSHLSQGNPVVMLCQGMDFVFADADFTHDVVGDYPGWPDARAVIGISDAIVTFLEHACTPGFPIHSVPVEVEAWFEPLPKQREITLMPRRRREDLLGAVQLMRRQGLNGWRIVPIDGMTQQEVAQAMGRSAIFLFGAEREGIGLPGAEAMAAGCYVIGFTGDGAKEYLTPDCAGVVLDSDVVGMCQQALEAMAIFDSDPQALAIKADLGRERILKGHSSDAVRTALATAFEQITAHDSPAVIQRSVRLKHYQAFGNRPGWHWAAYRKARTVGGKVVARLGR